MIYFSAEDEVNFNSSMVTKLQIDLDRNDRFLSEGNDQIFSIIDSSTKLYSTEICFSIKFDPLTHIGKSRKQNPKIRTVTECHLRKQNPKKFRKSWTLTLNILILWRHTSDLASYMYNLTRHLTATYDVTVQLSYLTSQAIKKRFLDFVSENDAGWLSQNVVNRG